MKNFWSGTNVVTEPGWGDAGKGKLVDIGAQEADLIVRYNGGNNAGHTVINERGEFKLHIIPSGIFNSRALSIISGNVVIDPFVLTAEIKALLEKGIKINPSNLLISEDAHLIMPWHKIRDSLDKMAKKGERIGTTGRGIGPTYADRTARKGLKIKDLLKKDIKKRFLQESQRQTLIIKALFGKDAKHFKIDSGETLRLLLEAREILAPLVTNTLEIIWRYEDKGKTILGEGAQGALLDLDLGGYPFVTSSNPGLSGFSKATGIYRVDKVIGVTKAYTTRVGDGPMPTELHDRIGRLIQREGNEVGTTTARVRRCGWLDIPAMRYGARIAGINVLAMTKLDIFDGLSKIKICTGYKIRGKLYRNITSVHPDLMNDVKPLYETLPGWQEDTSAIRSFSKLPKNAKRYINRVEKLMGLPIHIISIGPSRDATIYR